MLGVSPDLLNNYIIIQTVPELMLTYRNYRSRKSFFSSPKWIIWISNRWTNTTHIYPEEVGKQKSQNTGKISITLIVDKWKLRQKKKQIILELFSKKTRSSNLYLFTLIYCSNFFMKWNERMNAWANIVSIMNSHTYTRARARK